MEVPLLFRCPISMEMMTDPVTISTGVTYERRNIEKWFNDYKKTTCPATMQQLESFDLTPNHTLKRLINSWLDQASRSPSSSSPPSPARVNREELVCQLGKLESTPFKVSCLKKLRSMIEMDEDMKEDLVKLGGIETLGTVIFQLLVDNGDFATFRACEEALAVLSRLSLSDDSSVQLLSKPECVKSMSIMLQRGSAEARLNTVAILQKMVKNQSDWIKIIADQDIDVFKSLLELLSDEICTKASSYALDVLIEITSKSKLNLLKAIEAGAVCTLIELLSDANQHKCEKMLYLLTKLCGCPEGRSAFVDHGLAISVVSKKILRVSELATKMGVRILWLICSVVPTDRVLEEMVMSGSVKKILGLLRVEGRCSTKEKAMKIIKLHGNSWRQHPCFPSEFRDYLRFVHESR
ncbi:E3 ubiquitin-protein ligase PUB23-like [Aristolochia californica]|uniref:E3 ubiquitin-protein ligase PUB23-like n=1 Tax=Aristolochia californica TaxID=171875 RepID=UPI0035E04FC4